ncbi:hypothetical protein [Clostridium sp. AM58-1XD]|uniref:hypothetical protein n=1 Tax=Clostridium sp. AM58-1XD TaxID=2292307 RepID=UPI000E49ABAA|nr:hypothetical protein [Clostridium sp. AM58-1XD]RGZ00613.1 hypothetical protein DXA13_04005 [Clostridium sp. AM58-1XD]
MVEQETIMLLQECDAGIQMGISAIDNVLEYVCDETLKHYLMNYKDEHVAIQEELQKLLDDYHDKGKEPNTAAKSMSWLKINVKLVMNESDGTIADLITDGCNMGVKSLYKYLNQYNDADEESRDITKRLIKLEERLTEDMRQFLGK